MGKLIIDPGTPEARRAWLDSLPAGSEVVPAFAVAHKNVHALCIKDREHWLVDEGYGLQILDSQGFAHWCRDPHGHFWPVSTSAEPRANLNDTAAAIVEWQAATFGDSDAAATVAKMADEVQELREAVRAGDADHIREEAADVVFMVLDLMRAHGGPDALAEAMAAKLERNRKRTWTQGEGGKWSGSKADG